jgi:F-type H+-transporting ATPase subunit a
LSDLSGLDVLLGVLQSGAAEAEGAAATHGPTPEAWAGQHTIVNPICLGLRWVFVRVSEAVGVSPEGAEKAGDMFFQPFLVTTWLLCLGLIVLALVARKRLRRIPGKDVGGFMELVVEMLQDFVRGAIGPRAEEHIPFIASLFLFITVANWVGILPGVLSPIGVSTEDKLLGLNTTVALALTAIAYVHFYAIRRGGLKNYVMHFVGEPVWLAPINIPIHFIGELSRPVSLAFRLFGNIGGEDKVLHLLAIVLMISALPIHAPITLFAVFTGLLQAYVFTALTCSYIGGFLEHHDLREEGHHDSVQAHA